MTTPGGLAQVVQFAASTFTVNSGKLLCWSKGITVRGAGRGQTTLAKTNGAQTYAQLGVGPNPRRWSSWARRNSVPVISTTLACSAPPERRRRQGWQHGEGREHGRIFTRPDHVAGRGFRGRLADRS
jgi:hypothetical protein